MPPNMLFTRNLKEALLVILRVKAEQLDAVEDVSLSNHVESGKASGRERRRLNGGISANCLEKHRDYAAVT